MAKLLITYYSRTGNTRQMAELIAETARGVEGVEVTCQPIEQIEPGDMVHADGVVIGSPVYYGTMAAEVKQFFDASVVHHGKLEGKVGGAFASAGGPGGGAETTVLDIVKGLIIHGMIVQGDPKGDHYGPTAVGAPDERSAKECARFGKRTAELVKRLFG